MATIAKKTGLKEKNIQKCKDHVFNNEHILDSYGDVEVKKFDPSLEQALAWQRLKEGKGTEQDLEWLKHETAEQHHEAKFNATYNESHNRAQNKYDGHPWDPEKGTGYMILRLRQPPPRY